MDPYGTWDSKEASVAAVTWPRPSRMPDTQLVPWLDLPGLQDPLFLTAITRA